MTLTDAGPLIALLDEDDAHHADCLAAAERLPYAPLLTTWPCFTEAMYLLGEVGGYWYQARLWDLPATDRLVFHDLMPPDAAHMARLMETYRNVPMDLADASLIVTAERRALRRVFTIDTDFHVYRLADGSALEIIR